ncbi:unnamed protein product [Somion occarium]|uniref:FAD-binding oxidoreductase/transferase type 4 C-terminal domain-containing protein n=1 Tax=Somion occarium TaxID=3059160 RepID=A0ABP1DI25_9APHY
MLYLLPQCAATLRSRRPLPHFSDKAFTSRQLLKNSIESVTQRMYSETNIPNPRTRHAYRWGMQLVTVALSVAMGYALVQDDLGNIAINRNHFKYASPKELRRAISELHEEFPGDVTTDPDVLKRYGFSANSYLPASPHAVIVCVHSTEDVVKVINIARRYRVPVVPYSGATSIEGHFSGMPDVHDIGRWRSGLSSRYAMGGYQPNPQKQGYPIVLPTGSRTWCYDRRNDWHGLFRDECSPLWYRESGVIPERDCLIHWSGRDAGYCHLRDYMTGACTDHQSSDGQFPDVQRAVNAVQEILNSHNGSHIQCVELLDDQMIAHINAAGFVSRKYPVLDTLFLKLQRTEATIGETAESIQETTDVCVPVSRLPQLVYETKKDLTEAKIQSTIVGHVGNGNFHSSLIFHKDDELPAIAAAVHRLVERTIALDGTCTGEHGIGIGKNEYLIDELGRNTVEFMRTIKAAVDSQNILNPGKLYPEFDQSEQ